MPKKSKNLNYEDAVKRLEEIVSLMEEPDTTIDTSLKLYKEGIELATFCEKKLNETEGEISILKKTSKGLFTKKSFFNEFSKDEV